MTVAQLAISGIVLTVASTRCVGAQGPVALQLARELSIGSDSLGDDYLFSRIAFVVPLRDGSVVVGETRDRRLRRFGRDGRFLGRIGGPGAGPGEFGRVSQVGTFGDTLWVTDLSLRRASLFDAGGRYSGGFSWFASDDRESLGGSLWLGLFADGTSWAEPVASAATIGGPELPKTILSVGRDARVRDTIVVAPTKHTLFVVADGPTMNFGAQPFADAPIIVGSSGASRLFVVGREVSGTSQRAEIRVVALRPSGDTLWMRSFPYSPRRVSRDVSDSVLGRIHEDLRRSGATLEDVKGVLFLPRFRPPVTAAFATADGSLWLRREEDQSMVEYWIISPDGRHEGTVRVRRESKLVASEMGKVWASEVNEDEVPTVVRYRMLR
jgi:hypothetical protein